MPNEASGKRTTKNSKSDVDNLNELFGDLPPGQSIDNSSSAKADTPKYTGKYRTGAGGNVVVNKPLTSLEWNDYATKLGWEKVTGGYPTTYASYKIPGKSYEIIKDGKKVRIPYETYTMPTKDVPAVDPTVKPLDFNNRIGVYDPKTDMYTNPMTGKIIPTEVQSFKEPMKKGGMVKGYQIGGGIPSAGNVQKSTPTRPIVLNSGATMSSGSSVQKAGSKKPIPTTTSQNSPLLSPEGQNAAAAGLAAGTSALNSYNEKKQGDMTYGSNAYFDKRNKNNQTSDTIMSLAGTAGSAVNPLLGATINALPAASKAITGADAYGVSDKGDTRLALGAMLNPATAYQSLGKGYKEIAKGNVGRGLAYMTPLGALMTNDQNRYERDKLKFESEQGQNQADYNQAVQDTQAQSKYNVQNALAMRNEGIANYKSNDFVKDPTLKQAEFVAPGKNKTLTAFGLAKGGAVKGGTIKGSGTGTSDSIDAQVKENSFVVPAKNNKVAKTLREMMLGDDPDTMAKVKQGMGPKVKLSNGEHLFTPAERAKLEAKGVNLYDLAPEAEGRSMMAKGGDPPPKSVAKKTQIEPIYVDDKNDSRYRAYQDSLSLYNASNQARVDNLIKQGFAYDTDSGDAPAKLSEKEKIDFLKSYNPSNKKGLIKIVQSGNDGLQDKGFGGSKDVKAQYELMHSGIAPESTAPLYDTYWRNSKNNPINNKPNPKYGTASAKDKDGEVIRSFFNVPVYKKPVQPVILEKTKADYLPSKNLMRSEEPELMPQRNQRMIESPEYKTEIDTTNGNYQIKRFKDKTGKVVKEEYYDMNGKKMNPAVNEYAKGGLVKGYAPGGIVIEDDFIKREQAKIDAERVRNEKVMSRQQAQLIAEKKNADLRYKNYEELQGITKGLENQSAARKKADEEYKKNLAEYEAIKSAYSDFSKSADEAKKQKPTAGQQLIGNQSTFAPDYEKEKQKRLAMVQEAKDKVDKSKRQLEFTSSEKNFVGDLAPKKPRTGLNYLQGDRPMVAANTNTTTTTTTPATAKKGASGTTTAAGKKAAEPVYNPMTKDTFDPIAFANANPGEIPKGGLPASTPVAPSPTSLTEAAVALKPDVKAMQPIDANKPVVTDEQQKVTNSNAANPSGSKFGWQDGLGAAINYGIPLAQSLIGFNQLQKIGDRPVDKLDPDLVNAFDTSRSNAMKADLSARYGMSAEELAALRSQNAALTNAGRYAARNFSGGSGANALNMERSVINDSFDRALQAKVADKNLQMQKQQNAYALQNSVNSLAQYKQEANRRLFNDDLAAFQQKTDAASGLMATGLSNLSDAAAADKRMREFRKMNSK